MSSVKTTPAKTELSLSNIDSAHFTKDDFDPSNDLKVSLRIKPQKVRFVRRMLLFTTKFSNANCETSTAGMFIDCLSCIFVILLNKFNSIQFNSEAYREQQRRREGTFVQLLNVPRHIE